MKGGRGRDLVACPRFLCDIAFLRWIANGVSRPWLSCVYYSAPRDKGGIITNKCLSDILGNIQMHNLVGLNCFCFISRHKIHAKEEPGRITAFVVHQRNGKSHRNHLHVHLLFCSILF